MPTQRSRSWRCDIDPLNIALGYLYSAMSLGLINPGNARGALAAGCLLGGMDDLCAYAYEICKRSMNVHTISEWLKFLEPAPASADGISPTDPPSTSVFGTYAERLRSEVFNYLVVTLPNLLEVQAPVPAEAVSSGPSGRDTLLQIFSLVPFDMFKAAIESPTFQIGMLLGDWVIVHSSPPVPRIRSSALQICKRRH